MFYFIVLIKKYTLLLCHGFFQAFPVFMLQPFWVQCRLVFFPLCVDLVCSVLGILSACLIIRHEALWALCGQMCFVYVFLCSGVFILSRHHKQLWRYVSLIDFLSTIFCMIYVEFLFVPLLFFMDCPLQLMPSFVLVLFFINLVYLLWGRILFLLCTESFSSYLPASATKILVVGVTQETHYFLRCLPVTHGVLGVLGLKKGLFLCGYPGLGSEEALGAVLSQLQQEKMKPDLIVLSDPYPHAHLSSVYHLARKRGIEIKRLSSVCSDSALGDDLVVPSVVAQQVPELRCQGNWERMCAFYAGKRILIAGGDHPGLRYLLGVLHELGVAQVVLVGHHSQSCATAATFMGGAYYHCGMDCEKNMKNIIEACCPHMMFFIPALLSHGAVHQNIDFLCSHLKALRVCSGSAAESALDVFVNVSNTKSQFSSWVFQAALGWGEAYIAHVAQQHQSACKWFNVRHATLLRDPDLGLIDLEAQVLRGLTVKLLPRNTQRFLLSEASFARLLLEAVFHKVGSYASRNPRPHTGYVLSPTASVSVDLLMRRYLEEAHKKTPVRYVVAGKTGLREVLSQRGVRRISEGLYGTTVDRVPPKELNSFYNRIIALKKEGVSGDVLEKKGWEALRNFYNVKNMAS